MICVTLPGTTPAYTETFLQAHIDRLPTAVNRLGDFPIDVHDLFPKQISSDGTECLKRNIRVFWHSYVLNPIKRNALRAFFKKNHVDIILAEYGFTGVGVLSICQELHLPLVVHFHGYDAYQTDVLDRYKDAYKRMFSYASAIVAVSKHMIEQLIRLGAPTEKIAYIPYGVDIGKFAQASVLTSPLRVLSVGRFVEKKAPYLTILAFNKVLSRLPEARLVMVGAGPLHDVCCKLIKALRIEHAVELGGIANHDTVAALMQGARVFVQHSLVPLSGDTEGTPVAILEAGAAGLPVVSTHHAGISDVVIHGKTGFLVDEGDIQAMADYIYQLLTDPDLASVMGHNAREHVRANFTMQRSIGQLRNILEHCTTRDSTAIPELLSSPAASISSEEESASY